MNRNTDKINKPKTFHKLLEHSLESKRVPEDISCSKSVYCHTSSLQVCTLIQQLCIYISLKIHTLNITITITIKLQTFNSLRDQNQTDPIFKGLKPEKIYIYIYIYTGNK